MKEQLQKKQKELDELNKSWEGNYLKIQEENRREQQEVKKHILNQVWLLLQQAISSGLEIADKSIKQNENLEELVSEFTQIVKECYSKGSS